MRPAARRTARSRARSCSPAAKALRTLLGNEKAFEAAVAASDAGDAAKLNSVINGAGLVAICGFICEFFCSWRCVLGCLRLVQASPSIAATDEVAEAFAFAAATQ